MGLSEDRLAVDGGRPVRGTPFPAWPDYGIEEREALLRVLESRRWWRGDSDEISAFETEFSAMAGAARTVAVSNGTHALAVAALSAGLGPSDTAVLPSFTFVSTALGLAAAGVNVAIADVDPATWCLTPEIVEARDEHAQAVVPVHLGRQLADIDGFARLAASRSMAVIHDGAQAIGAEWQGRPAGTAGTTTFSFQAAKLITAGEGGAVTFNDEYAADRAIAIHNCGRTVGDTRYEHTLPGSNYRMSAFAAALLRAQLARLPQQINDRERNAALLCALLRERGEVQQRTAGCTRSSNYSIGFIASGIETKASRDDFVSALRAEGIPTNIAFPVLQDLPMFRRTCPNAVVTETPNARRVSDLSLWLSHRVLLGDENDVVDVVTAIDKVAQTLVPR